MELICKHCGKTATFRSREAVADAGWSIVVIQESANGQLVAGGEAVFCAQTPEADMRTFVEAAASAVVEGRLLE